MIKDIPNNITLYDRTPYRGNGECHDIIPNEGSQTEILMRSEDEILCGGSRGGGKDQPLDSLVYTLYGARKMGDLKVGDSILNPNGSPQKVIGVYPQGKKPVYRIVFTDGASTECGLEHLWLVRKTCGGQTKQSDPDYLCDTEFGGGLWTTKMIIDFLKRKDEADDGAHIKLQNLLIPLCNPLRFTRSYKSKYNFNGGVSELSRRIESVEYVGKKETQCISVSNRNGLYVTDDFIVTHNTFSGLLWMIEPEYVSNPVYHGLVIRKNADDLKQWIDEAQRLWKPLKVQFKSQPVTFTFPSGAKIVAGHMKDDQSYMKYVGQEFQKILIEELTQIPNEDMYDKLLSSLRSPDPSLRQQVLATTNPGGHGHAWVKARWRIGDPDYFLKPFVDEESTNTRIFIPSSIFDNPYLLHDNKYLNRLRGIKDPNLKKAWLFGDWNVFTGQFFTKFINDPKDEMSHVITPFDIPYHWKKFRVFDFSMRHPASTLWGATDKKNNLYIYREFLKAETPATPYAKIIKQMSGTEKYYRNLADPEMWTKKGQGVGKAKQQFTMVSTKDFFEDEGIYLEQANNDRKQGLLAIKNLMHFDPERRIPPRLRIFSSCKHLIRHIPLVIYHDSKPDDMDQSELREEIDGVQSIPYHWDDIDALRYLCMHIESSPDMQIKTEEDYRKEQWEDMVNKLTSERNKRSPKTVKWVES